MTLEDTLSKGIIEMTKGNQEKVTDCHNVSDTTATGSSRSGSPEDPTEHPEQSDQICVQGTRKDEIPVENVSEKIDELQNRNVLNGIGICDSTVADSSNLGDPIQDAEKTPLDTSDLVEQPLNKLQLLRLKNKIFTKI